MLYNVCTTKDCLTYFKIKVFEPYLSSQMDTCWKRRNRIQTSDGVYYLSDLDYSTRQTVIHFVDKEEYRDIADLECRRKLTNCENNFIISYRTK